MTHAFEFAARVDPDKPLQVPRNITDQLTPGVRARIIVLIDSPEDEPADLRVQQDALKSTWDDPAEDLYGEV